MRYSCCRDLRCPGKRVAVEVANENVLAVLAISIAETVGEMGHVIVNVAPRSVITKYVLELDYIAWWVNNMAHHNIPRT